MLLRPTRSTLFPYTTLFRSCSVLRYRYAKGGRKITATLCGNPHDPARSRSVRWLCAAAGGCGRGPAAGTCMVLRSEEHTSELQSRLHLVCRLLLEKKN